MGLWGCAIAAHEPLDMVALWRLLAAAVVRFGVLVRSRSCVGDHERAFLGCTWSLIPTTLGFAINMAIEIHSSTADSQGDVR